jgi:hypothetical protein
MKEKTLERIIQRIVCLLVRDKPHPTMAEVVKVEKQSRVRMKEPQQLHWMDVECRLEVISSNGRNGGKKRKKHREKLSSI